MSNNEPLPFSQIYPDLDPVKIKKQWETTRLYFRLLVGLVAAIILVLIAWVFGIAPIEDAQAATLEMTANLAVVLAPILAAAAGVERTLETVFNIIEGSWKSLVAYLGRGQRWLKTAEAEVEESRQWLAEISVKLPIH